MQTQNKFGIDKNEILKSKASRVACVASRKWPKLTFILSTALPAYTNDDATYDDDGQKHRGHRGYQIDVHDWLLFQALPPRDLSCAREEGTTHTKYESEK